MELPGTIVASADSPLCIEETSESCPAAETTSAAPCPRSSSKGLAWTHTRHPTPPGNSDGCETKGFAGKAIRNVMKTKGGSDRVTLTKLQMGRKKRVCMLLISKG